MCDDCLGSTWPEQDMIDAWLNKHGIVVDNSVSLELKQSFTNYRIAKDKQIEDLQARVNVAISSSSNTHEVDVLIQGLIATLDQLARLGGPAGGYGNSDGNTIALAALERYKQSPLAQQVQTDPVST